MASISFGGNQDQRGTYKLQFSSESKAKLKKIGLGVERELGMLRGKTLKCCTPPFDVIGETLGNSRECNPV